MAAFLIREIGRGVRRGEMGDSYDRKYIRRFLVGTTDPRDGQATVMTCPGLPQIWDSYETPNESDDIATCRRLRCFEQADHPTRWQVEVEYSTETSDKTYEDPNPLNEPGVFGWEVKEFQEARQEDEDGTIYANSAADPYDPPFQRRNGTLNLVVTKNLPYFDDDQAKQYLFHINATSFWGKDPGTMLCTDFSCAAWAFKNDVWFWPVRFRFEHNRDGWNASLLDAGFAKLNTGVTPPTPPREVILDPNGARPGGPTLLDGHGQPLAHGSAPVYNDFTSYPSAEFNDLGLP
jgi:hypothetical protein